MIPLSISQIQPTMEEVEHAMRELEKSKASGVNGSLDLDAHVRFVLNRARTIGVRPSPAPVSPLTPPARGRREPRAPRPNPLLNPNPAPDTYARADKKADDRAYLKAMRDAKRYESRAIAKAAADSFHASTSQPPSPTTMAYTIDGVTYVIASAKWGAYDRVTERHSKSKFGRCFSDCDVCGGRDRLRLKFNMEDVLRMVSDGRTRYAIDRFPSGSLLKLKFGHVSMPSRHGYTYALRAAPELILREAPEMAHADAMAAAAAAGRLAEPTPQEPEVPEEY